MEDVRTTKNLFLPPLRNISYGITLSVQILCSKMCFPIFKWQYTGRAGDGAGAKMRGEVELRNTVAHKIKFDRRLNI